MVHPQKPYKIIVKDVHGQELHCTVTDSTRLAQVASAIEKRWDLKPGKFRMVFDGRAMFGGVLGQYHMEDGDTIDMFTLQEGC